MARESANGRNGSSGPDSGNGPSLNRRSYLKLAGSAAIATAAVKTAGAADDYDVIEVAPGDTHTVRLGDGDRLENVVIDITARGAGYDIQAVGSDWVIQNVGIRGAWDHSPSASPFRVAVRDPDGSARIENLYLGDGVAGSFAPNAEPTGLYAYWYHAGTLEIRNVNVQGFSDNGMYLSAPGNSNAHPNPGHGGEIHIYDSYAKDNQVSGFRLGTDGSFCKNCVAVGGSHRGFWGYYGHTELIDCDLLNNSSGDIKLGTGPWDKSKQADVTVTNTRFGRAVTQSSTNDVHGSSAGTPEHRVPEGVPMSAEEAAAGTASGGVSIAGRSIEDVWRDDEANRIEFSGSSDSVQEYRLEGRGRAEYGDGADVAAADEYRETIDADGDAFSLAGYLGGSGTDGFSVEGAVTAVDVDDGVTVRVNGVAFDAADLEGIGSWEPRLENTIFVDGVGTTGSTRYEFAVSGAAEKATHKGASIDGEDTIESGQVTGAVASWRDAFRFSGDLEELTVDGAARVYVNDERVDPSDYGDDQPHTLTLVGTGSDANYEISVDGTIDPVAGDDAEQYATAASETTVEGSIDRGSQRFRFSGVLTDVTFVDGSAHVYLDDERIDPDEYGDRELLPHAIVIDGADTDGESTYSFAIDGDVIASSYREATIDADDGIEGQRVSGSVDEGLDAYWFDGNVDDFRLNGDANVDVEYNVRSR